MKNLLYHRVKIRKESMMNDTKQDVLELVKSNEEKCLSVIKNAQESGRIDMVTREYLERLYSNSMDSFRKVFLYIGKCFGAPKASVRAYNYETDSIINKAITISEINPLSPYLVNHRLDTDPMRNQFFMTDNGHKIDTAVSSIVTVIVGAQKHVNRAIDKITNKYYPKYTDEVCDAVYKIIADTGRVASAVAVCEKIRELFAKTFISDASVAVLGIIGTEHRQIAADLVRELDKIRPPYKRLRDVWRIKCLFDLVPQARTFISRICDTWPDNILEVRDKFFDVLNPRGYRDAKLILNIGDKDKIIPMEIICQVRTFFEFEHKTHNAYEKSRKSATTLTKIEEQTELIHTQGVKKYNKMINYCVADLFDRIGWNILYSSGNEDMLFEGFPRLSDICYPQKVVDDILKKVDNAVNNEVFFVENAPLKLNKDQEIRIFRWMARFILISAMPFIGDMSECFDDTMSGKFFSFIMNELQRYYKNAE